MPPGVIQHFLIGPPLSETSLRLQVKVQLSKKSGKMVPFGWRPHGITHIPISMNSAEHLKKKSFSTHQAFLKYSQSYPTLLPEDKPVLFC